MLRVSGIGTMVYVEDPAVLKTVFGGDPTVYHAGEANSMMIGLLGSSSVVVLDEDAHRDRRRLMLAPFRREAVATQAEVMAELAAENISTWPVGVEFAVAPRMSQLTLEVILRSVIGASDPARLAELRAVMPKLLDCGMWQTLAILNPDLQRHRPWRRLRRQIAEADRLLYAEIADRRADPRLGDRTDALSLMIRAGDNGQVMSESELRDQMMTLLVAGHDTTASALSWALERLTRHPGALRKAVEAARASSAGDPAGDEYLDAVAKEVLRIRPVVFEAGRVLTVPTDVAGYRLPAGVTVAPGIGLVHGNPVVYSNPARFDPDRMVGAAMGPTTWLPFGGGNRRCLGATFAMAELRIVLREVLRRVELATTTAASERQQFKSVSLMPHRGARIRVSAIYDVEPVSAGTTDNACPFGPDRATTVPHAHSENPLRRVVES